MSENTRTERDELARAGDRGSSKVLKWLPLLAIASVFLVAPFAASAAGFLAEHSEETLEAGAEVYSESCAACHQAGGVGVPGQFPPLVGNSNVDDAEYVETVILNGLTGEIVVNGQTYDGVMPAQSTLSDDDVTSVIAYIQSGFAAPAAPEVVPESSDESGMSALTLGFYIALGVAVLLGATVFRKRIIAVNDPRELSWPDAWMKTAVIVAGLILATTLIPAWAWESDVLQDLSGTQQDLITIGIWSLGLGGSLFALWYLHRKNRI